mgnify:CR=1 FL=1|tara:strand:+ start:3782 stop:4381 length:600 start_codon:yes stop_codon:yes gene_type:complete
MSCNTCGNTKSSPCACQDHGLTTPCSYTNCSNGTPCEEVICSECVVDCSKHSGRSLGSVSWDAETSTGVTSTEGLKMRSGDSVQEMLQRTALFVADPVAGASTASVAIAPFRINSRTKDSIGLSWSNVPVSVSSISIYQAEANSRTWTLNSTISSELTTSLTKTIIGLSANKAYKFKLISSDGKISANSVAIYANTLAK